MAGHLHLAPEPGSHDASRETSPIRVVIGDDHVAVRRSLRLLLDGEDGVEVVAEAADLPTAVRQVHGQSPHVLVLDLELHNGSTLATISQLRAHVPDTQIVVLTMEASAAFARQAIDAGAIGFVLKERADRDLPAALRAAVRGEEYVSPPIAARLEAISEAGAEDGVTSRELDVLRLIALGHTSAEIATQLHLSRRTIESHRTRIHRKLGLATRAELVRYALGRHLVEL